MAGRIGFVGLGVMGGPMAGHLLREGADLVVWNRTAAKAEPLKDSGATVADELADLAKTCEIIFLCVSRTEDVEECLAALEPAAAPSTLFIDHSTISPPAAQAISGRMKSKGLRFVDAPITGGSMGAKNGSLTIFLGGEPDDCEEAIVATKPYAKRAERVGGPGMGQMAKMANQIAVGGALLALCESLAFAKKAGLDQEQVHKLLSSGAAGSWAFDNYGPKILAGDWIPGFSIQNQVKDFGYCAEAAESIGALLPGTTVVHELLREMLDDQKGDLTTAALYEHLLEKSRKP